MGGIDALDLPVLPVSGLCPAMHGSQRFSTAPNSGTIYPISYLTRLKNKQVSVVLTQIGHLLLPSFQVLVHHGSVLLWVTEVDDQQHSVVRI